MSTCLIRELTAPPALNLDILQLQLELTSTSKRELHRDFATPPLELSQGADDTAR